jgi:hypothetical protein
MKIDSLVQKLKIKIKNKINNDSIVFLIGLFPIVTFKRCTNKPLTKRHLKELNS